jgi:MinD superfamily P-loop ATPase
LDCDTEEPNCSIFIKSKIDEKTEVSLKIPHIDSSACSRCKKCSENCYYGAISIFKQSHMIFDFLCHGCGLCTYICPCNAIKETEKAIGNINSYIEKDNIVLHEGILNIGQASGVRIIRKMKEKAADSEVTILDSPPGSSCSVVETLKDIDMALVVTEPTPYGLHDVDAVIQLCKNMGIPFSVIINKDCGSYEKMDLYFAEKGIEIVSRIPFSEEISEQSSNGSLLIDGKSFLHIFERICKSIGVSV